jgi:hypothetical protein
MRQLACVVLPFTLRIPERDARTRRPVKAGLSLVLASAEHRAAGRAVKRAPSGARAARAAGPTLTGRPAAPECRHAMTWEPHGTSRDVFNFRPGRSPRGPTARSIRGPEDVPVRSLRWGRLGTSWPPAPSGVYACCRWVEKRLRMGTDAGPRGQLAADERQPTRSAGLSWPHSAVSSDITAPSPVAAEAAKRSLRD